MCNHGDKRRSHRLTDGHRNDAHAILKRYLSYFSVNDETFIRALFPATRVETIFDVTAFAEVVRNGTLAAVHFNCAQTNATQVPTLKTLSKRLNECSEKILKFNADLLTTSRQEIESLNKQIEAVLAKQKIMKETKMPKVRLQVFLEHVQVLQKDALKLAKVMPWTKETFGIEMDAFEELIIDIKDKLEEATTNKKIEEDQKRNTTNEIAKMASSASSLPYLRGKSDFLPWIKVWEEIAPFLSSEITKINLIKTSLNKYDQMQTKHFTTLSPLLEYILSKYGQPLDQVPLLLQKLTNLKPPANWKESIYNIQVVLTTYTQLNDWDQQHRFDPWSRDCVKHKVIFGTMFLNFMKDIEEFDIQLNYKSSIVPTESFALQNIREAIKEGSSDEIEKQRREFFISKLKTYLILIQKCQQSESSSKTTTSHFAGQGKQGGASKLDDKCQQAVHLVKGRSSNSLNYCPKFKELNEKERENERKRLGSCIKCLRPRETCKDPDDLTKCVFAEKYNLKCRTCDQTNHNTLLCRKKANTPNMKVGFERGRGRARGGVRGRGTRGHAPTRGGPSQQVQALPQQQQTDTLH